ncbi:hypothetical protein [uncultured Tolumonas sp.]|uniref:hypothetical protein n=1 Tax=uncultured Tolumonas sp. TaxID=263765 RepID=UPI00293090B3|nr:hypothetical protein [uncultured Tolumonas sp.]
MLAETSSIGIHRPEIGVRVISFPHVSHVIYYIQQEHQLVVFGVLHKRIVPFKHLLERDII